MADLFKDLGDQIKGQTDSLTGGIKAGLSGLTATNLGKGLLQSDILKDWDHASKLFTNDIAGKESLHPKQSFLYHVFFELNYVPGRDIIAGRKIGATVNERVADSSKQKELGMLVKQVTLPKFTIDTKTLNAYNRPHVIQQKLNYDPITITFHDDSANVVRNFWYDYMTYYYRNNDKSHGTPTTTKVAGASHKELLHGRTEKDWGYSLRGTDKNPVSTDPYLSSIRIYSLHNKRFSEYILINPIIKSFAHGEHSSSDETGILSHTMTVEFESVQYASGKINRESKKGPTYPLGFGDIHYDKRPSPLTAAGGGTTSLFGSGGFMETGDEVYEDFENGDYGSALFKGAKGLKNLQGANLGALASGGLLSLGKNYINGPPNPSGSVASPKSGPGENK